MRLIFLDSRTALQFRCLVVLLGLSLATPGAVARLTVAEKLKPIPPCPSLVAAANYNRIPITGLDAWSGTDALRPGDSATVLVTFVQKKKHTQWLLYLEAATPDPNTTNQPVAFHVASAFGPPMKFISKPHPVKLRMFGPFTAEGRRPPKVQATSAQCFVDEDFLGLGLDRPAALLHRWNQATKLHITNGMNSKALLAMNPTLAEQRALAGMYPALNSYFEVVQRTPALQDLLRRLVDFPSLWSIIKHRGVTVNLTFGDHGLPFPASLADWNVRSSAAAWYFPWLIRLNGQPGLKITLVVTEPQRPLLICGGVVAVLAEEIGDEQTYMTLRVVSARNSAVREK